MPVIRSSACAASGRRFASSGSAADRLDQKVGAYVRIAVADAAAELGRLVGHARAPAAALHHQPALDQLAQAVLDVRDVLAIGHVRRGRARSSAGRWRVSCGAARSPARWRRTRRRRPGTPPASGRRPRSSGSAHIRSRRHPSPSACGQGARIGRATSAGRSAGGVATSASPPRAKMQQRPLLASTSKLK